MPALDQDFDLIETFLTRWYAGQTEILDQFGILLGREIGPDDVEPLTWAMAEEGRRRHRGSTCRRSASTMRSGECSASGSTPVTTCC